MPTKDPPQSPPAPDTKQPTVKEILNELAPRSKPLSARALAWLAEGADGRRDQALAICVNANGKLQLMPRGEVAESSIVVDVYTKSRKAQPREKLKVTIPVDWDAIFLGESAVEKFAFPYYEAQRLLTATELKALKAAFYNRPDVIGVAHKPPSRPLLLVKDGDSMVGVEFEVGAGLEIEIGDPDTLPDF